MKTIKGFFSDFQPIPFFAAFISAILTTLILYWFKMT